MTNRLSSWEELLGHEGRSGDGRWARLVLGPEMVVETEIRELGKNPPVGGVNLRFVWGERCRSLPDLFREWGNSLDFPGYSGHNWDAFGESLEELVEWDQHNGDGAREEGQETADTALVLVANSQDLLRDEPEEAIRTLMGLIRSAALGLAWEDKDRPRLAEFIVLFQCEHREAETLKERLTRAGLDL